MENKIRGQIQDTMQPGMQKIEQARDSVRDMRDALNNMKAQIEDLELGQMRLSRYDEYFSESNKKLSNIEITLKLQDKRITEEVLGVVAHKDKLGSRIIQLEQDFQKFKGDVNDKYAESMGLLEDVHKVKSDMHLEVIAQMSTFHEEIIIQNERIMEIGIQIYNTRNFTERKFIENAEFDVRIRTANNQISETQERITKLKDKIKKMKDLDRKNDIHLKKYLPL